MAVRASRKPVEPLEVSLLHSADEVRPQLWCCPTLQVVAHECGHGAFSDNKLIQVRCRAGPIASDPPRLRARGLAERANCVLHQQVPRVLLRHAVACPLRNELSLSQSTLRIQIPSHRTETPLSFHTLCRQAVHVHPLTSPPPHRRPTPSARRRTPQDTVGYILHSLLLVPYFSWQRSHAVHHSRTNHIDEGETHVPMKASEPDGKFTLAMKKVLGPDAFAVVNLLGVLAFGWPVYLLTGASGGPVRGKTNHFWPWAGAQARMIEMRYC